jgi:hypothetical protein
MKWDNYLVILSQKIYQKVIDLSKKEMKFIQKQL